MKSNNTLLGIIGAAAIGAALGILFAPDKGTNTRKKISKKSCETTDEIKFKLDQLKDVVSKKYNEALATGENIVENGKSEFDNIKNINKEKII